MDRIKVYLLTFTIATSSIQSHIISQPAQRPLCASQLALVNWACSKVRFPPPAAVFPPPIHFPFVDEYKTEPSANIDRKHEHRHHHGHGHRPGFGGVGYFETPEEKNCCRWLNDVDDECVCELLIHLPSFLARPLHEYTVVADPTCNVTFSCAGAGPV